MFWIVVYTHRHGVTVWPVSGAEAPTEAEVIAGLDVWEPDQNEYIRIDGPFTEEAMT